LFDQGDALSRRQLRYVLLKLLCISEQLRSLAAGHIPSSLCLGYRRFDCIIRFCPSFDQSASLTDCLAAPREHVEHARRKERLIGRIDDAQRRDLCFSESASPPGLFQVFPDQLLLLDERLQLERLQTFGQLAECTINIVLERVVGRAAGGDVALRRDERDVGRAGGAGGQVDACALQARIASR
jgi:hypothetical protein